mgnify:CR=1 FL=1
MQKLNSNLLKKVSSKKTSLKDSILFTICSFATLYGLIYALCMILTLIDAITL